MNRIKSKGKLKQFIGTNRDALLYVIGITIFLIALNFAFWPTPDEYFYLSVSGALEDALRTGGSVGGLNTEHVALVPFLVALFNIIVHERNFIVSSIPIILFSLGTVLLIFAIARQIGLDYSKRMWWMWLLLLVPGFWMFSTRLMLDIPATFAFTLLLYVLLRKSRAILIGLAALLVLVTKEYYFYLTFPLILGMTFFDLIFEKGSVFLRILKAGARTIVIYLPGFLGILLFLNFNFLPYPRLLEASLQVLFGDAYVASQKVTLRVMGKSTETVAHALETVDSLSPSEADEQRKIAQNLVSKSDELQLSGNIPNGIVNSNNPEPIRSPWQKWWLVYKYNFSEDDVNVFILPFLFIGIGLSILKIRRLKRSSYKELRADILFLLTFGIFIYFNYHQADWRHGFRIVLPMTAAMIYFSFFGVQAILEKPTQKIRALFSGLFLASLILYLVSIYSYQYGGVLANSTLIAPFLSYKPYIFTALFVLICVYLLYYHRLAFSWKQPMLLAIIVGLVTLKFGFLFGNSILQARAYEYDYGASYATPTLHAISLRNERVYGNMHPYRIQYYANDHRIPSQHIYPFVRDISPRNPKLYFGGAIDERIREILRMNEIRYVFVVVNGFTDGEIETMESIASQYPEEFIQLDEYQDSSGRALWRVYEFKP